MMIGLRWTLGIIIALVAGGLTALAVWGSGFRRSFGASDNAPWLTFGPFLIALLLIASLAWPERRALMHTTAVIVLALGIGCGFLAREAPFVATLGAAYVAAWLAYYYKAVWAVNAIRGAGP